MIQSSLYNIIYHNTITGTLMGLLFVVPVDGGGGDGVLLLVHRMSPAAPRSPVGSRTRGAPAPWTWPSEASGTRSPPGSIPFRRRAVSAAVSGSDRASSKASRWTHGAARRGAQGVIKEQLRVCTCVCQRRLRQAMEKTRDKSSWGEMARVDWDSTEGFGVTAVPLLSVYRRPNKGIRASV